MGEAGWWTGLAALAIVAAAAAAVVLVRRQRRDGARARAAADALRDALRAAKQRLVRGEIDVEAYEAQRRELVDALLQQTTVRDGVVATRNVLLGVCGALFIGVLVLGYVFRDVLLPRSAPTEPARPAARAPLNDDQLARMVASAQERTRTDPTDAEAWALLAHSLDMMGKFAESSAAYAKLVELAPRDAQAWADYADALAVAKGRRFEGRPTELIERALSLDAGNAKALALAGSAAYQRRAWRDALGYWTRARDAASDPAFRSQLEASVQQARVQLGEAPARASAPSIGTARTVSGRVLISDELARTLPADATVFVFARPADGSRMPVALLKRRVSDLPLEFTLDDSTGMVPGVKLSQQSAVVVGARVSRDGDVLPKPGDAEGWSAPVPVGASGVRLEISERLK